VGKVHTYIYTHKTPKGPKTGADFCFQAKENVLRFRTISLLPGKSTLSFMVGDATSQQFEGNHRLITEQEKE